MGKCRMVDEAEHDGDFTRYLKDMEESKSTIAAAHRTYNKIWNAWRKANE